jgi:hypothetical protein
MLRTKSIVASVTDVPREWVFEFYLSLPVLQGQDLKIKSPFNMAEKNPSFFIYYSRTTGYYSFKDFSTDRQGDGVELVMHLFSLSTRGESAHKIIDDYNKYVAANPDGLPNRDFKLESKYKVTDYVTREWNQIDANFWTKFKVSSKLLKHYRVKPLEYYYLTKEGDDGKAVLLTMDRSLMYGYFREDGTLYKIYQPFTKNNKFIKVAEYIQGTDQLTFKTPYLVICSSLKDMMAFNTLGFSNAEVVAPDSENILIEKEVIDGYKEKYKAICTLFDNDAAGIQSMHKYEKKYAIPYVHLVLEKDTADNVEEHGIKNTRVHIYPLLTKALTGVTKQL